MVTRQHDTDGNISCADRTFLNRICRVLDGVPWKSLLVLILLSLSSHISSCYAGPHAESVSSSTISVLSSEAPTDQAIRHVSIDRLTIAADGSLSAHMQEIQKTLQAIERRLAPTPPTSQPPQQPCSISVNCPADSERDLWLTGQLQNIEGKIDKLIGSRPPPVSDSEQCRFHLSTSQEVPDKFSVESTKSITDCVGLLIQRVTELDRVATEQLSAKKNTSATGDPQGRPDVKTLVVDILIQRVDELSKQANHPKETLNNSGKSIPLWAIFAGLLAGVVLFPIGTTWSITLFMKEHYETNDGNVFQDVAHLLATSPEQLSEEERHYSNLRFAVFTIFIGICGALGTIYLQKDYQDTTKSMHDILPIIGIFATIVFASFEFAIDWIETEYGYMSRAIWIREIVRPRFHVTTRKANPVSIGGATDPMKWVRYPIWTIFGLSTIFWLYLLFPHQQPLDPVEAGFHETHQHEAIFWFALIMVLISVLLFSCFLKRCGGCFKKRLVERLSGKSGCLDFYNDLKRCLIGERASRMLARLRGR